MIRSLVVILAAFSVGAFIGFGLMGIAISRDNATTTTVIE